MATFSTNQARQLYVAYTDDGVVEQLGDIAVHDSKDALGEPVMWFEHMGYGGRTSSDKIVISNIVDARSTGSNEMKVGLKRYKIELVPEVINETSHVIPGKDYILKLAFDHYVGMSDEDQYWKFGMVHSTSKMSPNVFYQTLAESIFKNLGQEYKSLINIYVHSKATVTEGNFVNNFMQMTPEHYKNNGAQDSSNSYYAGSAVVTDIDYIVIEQVEQPWVLGKIQQAFIGVTAQPDTVENTDKDEIIWGKVTEEAATSFVEDGHLIADLEYFCMGERGDIYRGMGYPNNIETKYMVKSDKKYDTLDIHYYYAGPAEDVQKSPKTITIVAEDTGAHALIGTIIDKVNLATGLTIKKPAEKPNIA